ncbi:MAG TPA: carbohydrate-binding protein [Vicinamibacterales bacterium]|nr:carbohydrate-binding protein [Vicinamibacterales bacterium]
MHFIPRIGLAVTLVSSLLAVPARAQELMPASTAGWSGFSPRAETAPGLLASAGAAGYSLEIQGNGVPNVYGGWRTRIQGLVGGNYYRFRARALPVAIESPRESVTILLRWRGAFGDEVAPDYVWQYRLQPDDTLLFDRIIQAPPGTTAVDVELVLQWAPDGRVRFDALSFMPAAAPASRPVKVAAVYFRPSGTSSGLESVQRAAQYGEEVAAAHRPDVMVFGEMLNVIGAPGTFDAKAEAVPGPSTDVMAGVARAYSVNVVFGILERHDRFLYNTAVLLDRSGNLVGKYRKVQLPLSEVSAGVTPGDNVPVFEADFGRVALLICQDTSFPEPTREAAIQGAEMLLVPIWGGKQSVVHARAIEHSMYVAASGYDYASEVVDPLGTVLDAVKTLGQAGVAVATIDLSRRFREDWSGDWRDTSSKQRRTAPYKADANAPPGGDPPPPPPSDTTAPVVSLTAPASGATVSGVVTVAASASDNVGVTAVRFALDGAPLGADDATAPYSISWDSKTTSDGAHTLTATASDAAGNTASSSITVNVANATTPPGSTPFTGTPVALPGRIEAENFDNGGANVAYFDTTAGNRGGVYRETDVDLEATSDTGGGYNVAKIRASEWVKYSVNVPTAGTYTLRVRVAAAGAGGRFHVESDGVDRTGPLTVPDTGGWQVWTTITAPMTLAAGQQVLRVVIDAESSTGIFGNINWLEVAATASGSTPFTGTPVSLPGRIEAEGFDNGGADVAYRDTTAGNEGGAYRQTDVDIEPASDSGGGYNVGWMRAGEWLNYSVNVATPGTYTLRVRVAAEGAGGRFHIDSNGVDRTGPVTIPNTGGWQVWTTITATISLPAGQQVLRLVVDAESTSGIFGNINWFELAASSSMASSPQPGG